jgi:hypothetical protein
METMVEVTWSGSGRHMSGGERGKCDNGRVKGGEMDEWRTCGGSEGGSVSGVSGR